MADNVELNLGAGGKTIATDDIAGIQHELVKVEFGSDGSATMVDPNNPLPVIDDEAGTALAAVLAKLSSDPATQTTLAAILAKLIVSPSTEAKQDVANALLSLLATSAKQDTLIAKDFATQTTLAALLAKVIAAPATEAKQDTGNTSLGSIDTKLSAPATVLHGQTTVTTAGTRVVLAASTTCKSVTIKAFITNIGFIYVGSSTVTSANGFRLNAGDTISLDIANLNTVNIDSSVSGESVSYLGVQ